MTSMVERVARALCTQCADDPDRVVAPQQASFKAWEIYEPLARAAIEAMREEINLEMYRAMLFEYGTSGDMNAVWRAAIDEALK